MMCPHNLVITPLAGMAGFEPTLSLLSLVPESKSGALPLGYIPIFDYSFLNFLSSTYCRLFKVILIEKKVITFWIGIFLSREPYPLITTLLVTPTGFEPVLPP